MLEYGHVTTVNYWQYSIEMEKFMDSSHIDQMVPQLLHNSHSHLLVIVDEHGVILSLNDAYAKNMSRSKSELIGTNLNFLIHDVDAVSFMQLCQDLSRNICTIRPLTIRCLPEIEDLTIDWEFSKLCQNDQFIGIIGLGVVNNKVNQTDAFIHAQVLKQLQEELDQEHEVFSSGPVISVVWNYSQNWPV